MDFRTFAVMPLLIPALGWAAEGVSVGGDVSISTSAPQVTTRASGPNAISEHCVGAVSGKSVSIGGSVTITGSNGSHKCVCSGTGCPPPEGGDAPPSSSKNN
jgi:hypothetical protein